MTLKVLNMKHLEDLGENYKHPTYGVIPKEKCLYVGRGGQNYGYFGSPFPISDFSLKNSLIAYIYYLYYRMDTDKPFKRNVLRIKKHKEYLICWCKGLDNSGYCHAEIIADFLNERLTLQQSLNRFIGDVIAIDDIAIEEKDE